MPRRTWDHLEEYVGGALLVLAAVIVTIQVIWRWGFTPLSWTQEAANLLFIWAVFFGASLALKKNEHFALEMLADNLPLTVRKSVRVLVSALVALFCVALFVLGVKLAYGGWNVVTPALELPRTVPYAALPIGAALMFARAIEQLVAELKRPRAEEAGA